MMNNLKTTVILLLALVLSLLWVFRPVAPVSTDEVVWEKPSAPGTEEAVERSLAAISRKERSHEHTVFQLKTLKSLEEQRLFDLSLYRFLTTHGAWSCQLWKMPAEEDGMSALERLATEREARLQKYHENFQGLEDFVLDTEFTELSEEEADMVFRYYEFRKRIDEAFFDYFETPPETWLELEREKWHIGESRVFQFLQRQYQHDVGGMTLEDAIKGFFPQGGGLSISTCDDLGRRFSITVELPRSGGLW